MTTDRRFLLTFYDDNYKTYGYNWYEYEEEMKENIQEHPEWSDFEASEIFSCREVELS